MNILSRLLTASVIATCATALAQDPDPSQAAADASYPFIKTPAEESATLAERVKFGYGSNGMGVVLIPLLHQLSGQLLRCMAGTGDAGAARALWFRWADAEDKRFTHMTEAEELAVEQYRLIGHTILIHDTAARYSHAATEECEDLDGNLDRTCMARNANFQKAAAWYKLGEKLGDPVCARGFDRLRRLANPDVNAADGDAEALLVRTQPAPDAVERYAYQCRNVEQK